MKAQLILKTVVVAMAAFGAYAFSGNTQPNLYSYKDSGVCIDVVVPCTDTGNNFCKVIIDNSTYDVWDLNCMRFIKHDSPEPIQL
ncbi:hypothetical protein [Gelidibacter sp. F63206]|uniref:hypothetical protein n=1 Tax=Gelidibacter sp. F63206 TaxID=2926425 RepID=UPI001FF20A08|nr:hypothetical protein [Gelidibacter sp. F63206]MCK0114940.1 hypothetical protein [Gelidibacter sp. F63206]